MREEEVTEERERERGVDGWRIMKGEKRKSELNSLWMPYNGRKEGEESKRVREDRKIER